MDNSKHQLIGSVLFFGAIWGILEATLGYVLQFFPPHYSGMIMFPIASLILITAYNQTRSRRSLLAIGFVAASIKGINLLMPFYQFSPWKTINPMMSIILESLLVSIVVIVIVKKPWTQKVGAFLFASISWRALYLLFMGGQFVVTGFVHNDIASLTNIVTFMFLHGIFSAFIAVVFYGFYNVVISERSYVIKPKPLLTTSLVVVALLLTILL